MAEIYMLTSPSGKSYVGFTTNTAQERFVSHREHSQKGVQYLINKAIRKYGWRSFKVQTLLSGPEHILRKLESNFIDTFKTLQPNGHNMTEGGDGVVATPEVRAKISAKAKEFWKRPEYRERQGVALRAVMASPETRARMSNAQLGNTSGRGKKIKSFSDPRVPIPREISDRLRAIYISHMEGRVKAKNGFLLKLQKEHSHLSYWQIVQICHGFYDRLED